MPNVTLYMYLLPSFSFKLSCLLPSRCQVHCPSGGCCQAPASASSVVHPPHPPPASPAPASPSPGHQWTIRDQNSLMHAFPIGLAYGNFFSDVMCHFFLEGLHYLFKSLTFCSISRLITGALKMKTHGETTQGKKSV